MATTQAVQSTRSDHNDKDVFLSHSGKQKNFVRQLHTDLTNQGVSCFFDEDPESLPKAEEFPPIIFERAETCKVAVLLLSKDFLETKWPMLELASFVEARDTTRRNPNLKILPLFYLISPDALKDIKADNGKWKQLDISGKRQAEWLEALRAIRRINGINFREGDNEVEFREKIVTEIRRILPPSQRYHIPRMQGGERMCQEVTNCFNKVHPNDKGIRIAGLYGIAGHGKTSLGKAFCNLKLRDFEGKVCHLEFSRGDRDDSFERRKLALQYLTHCPQSHLQTLTKDQAEVELNKRLKGEKVLLVLDNITEENIEEVRDYIEADFSEDSYILLSARSVDLLVKHFQIESQSCMRVPSLEEDEAIRILLERTSVEESTLGTEDKTFVLKCANRCSFNCDSVRCSRTFHPLALKAFGRHLSSKYGSNLSKWVAEIDGLVDRSGYGLDDVFNVLRKAFDDMRPKYRTIFMLLTVYMLPNMSPHKVTEWLAINCNEEISFINKAVEDLCRKAFVEEFDPEIRIHDLYIEFAQSTAKEMGRWLWWKGDESSTRGLISQDQAGFELAKLEECMHRHPSQIPPKHLENLLLLQLVGVRIKSKLDFTRMYSLRSITLQNCEDLAALEGMESLAQLAWVQISNVNPIFELPKISNLKGLQHLEIDIPVMQALGDLTTCSHLREINVHCPSLPEFPRLNGLPHLEKVEFSACIEVKEPLDCTNCVSLQSIVLNGCRQMTASPVLTGCKKVCKIVLSECDAVMACPDIDVAGNEPSTLKTLELSISSKAASLPRCLESCDGLENLHLWNMGELMELPSFNDLSNLTVLKIGKCGIREPPDLRCCVNLETVYFFTLNNLERFPNFSLLRKLKILSLYNCRRVQDPPDINGCHELQVFHVVYNDNMKGLPKMHECTELDEIKVSWQCKDEITYEGIDPDNFEVDDDFQFCLQHFKDEIPVENLYDASVPIELREWLWKQEKRWMQGRTMLVKKYFRGVKLFCSVMASYESYQSSNCYSKNYITLRLVDSKVIAFPTPGNISKDRFWLNKVIEYFAGKEVITRGSVKLIASPTLGRVGKNRGCFNEVQKCFVGKKDIDRSSVVSLNVLKPPLNGRVTGSPTSGRVGKYCGWLNKVQTCFAGMKDIVRASAASGYESSEAIYLPPMQGEARICQKVAGFFNTVFPNKRLIRIAGLYGMPGMGKTRLSKAFCNVNLRECGRKAIHVEFCGANALDRQKFAIQYPSHSDYRRMKWFTHGDDLQVSDFFSRHLEGENVLLVLDNITEDSIDKARDYLGADLGEQSSILLTAQSVDVLKKFKINSESCMRIPRLTEEEAIAILLESTTVAVSELEAEDRGLCLKCANRCSFKEGRGIAQTFHPLALKAFGRHCFRKHQVNLSKWVAEIDRFPDKAPRDFDDDVRRMAFDVVFDVLAMVFDDMDPKSRLIFMIITVFMHVKLYSKGVKWLAENSKEEVEDLYNNGFIEEIEPEIRIHDAIQEFAGKLERRGWQDNRAPAISPRYRVPDLQGKLYRYPPFSTTTDVPSVTEEEAIAILLEKALETPALSLFCQYTFGKPTISIDPHFDQKLVEQIQAECKGLPLAVHEIVSSNYRKDGFLSRLKTNIDVLDDDEKQCFLDVAAFPQRKSAPANALLDIWVYVRGMNRDKAVLLLLMFASRHLLHLGRDTRQPTIRDDCLNSYTFSQDDVQRNLALFLAELDNKIRFRWMYVSQKQSDFYQMRETDRCQSSKAQIVSIHTGAMTDAQWSQMDFPEAEALVLYFTTSDYRYYIPPFFFMKMEKLKVLIIHNDSEFEGPAKLTGLDNFRTSSQLRALHLEGLIIPSLLEHCRVLESLEKIHVSLCEGLARDKMFIFPGLLECYVESCIDLKELPEGICSSESLKVLSITGCESLERLPDKLDMLGSLKEIRLCGCIGLKAMPPSFCELTKLEIIDISQCTGLYVHREGHSALKETLQKLAKLRSLKSLICDEFNKELFNSSSMPGLKVEFV